MSEPLSTGAELFHCIESDLIPSVSAERASRVIRFILHSILDAPPAEIPGSGFVQTGILSGRISGQLLFPSLFPEWPEVLSLAIERE